MIITTIIIILRIEKTIRIFNFWIILITHITIITTAWIVQINIGGCRGNQRYAEQGA